MLVKIFLSAVCDEFRSYRDEIRHDLTKPNVEVKVQEDFEDLSGDMLDKLDVYIARCDAVVPLIGNMTGSAPGEPELLALRKKYPDLTDKLPPLGEALQSGISVSNTQWEAWLALYHDKRLFIAEAGDGAERGPKYTPTDESRAAQARHLAGLKKADRYPGHTFVSPADLAKHIAFTAILDLLAAGRDPAPTTVFICYRRDDTRWEAKMIHEALCKVVPSNRVFKDVDSIPLGANFQQVLQDSVGQCEALLALIGPKWIDARDPKTNARKLEDSNDYVRIEIGAALARGIPVVPVLIDGAPIPDENLLPNDLKELARRQAQAVEFRTFEADVERLIRKLGLNQVVGRTVPS